MNRPGDVRRGSCESGTGRDNFSVGMLSKSRLQKIHLGNLLLRCYRGGVARCLNRASRLIHAQQLPSPRIIRTVHKAQIPIILDAEDEHKAGYISPW